MKSINKILFLLIMFVNLTYSQNGFNYQSIVRNSVGLPLSATTVHLKFSIYNYSDGLELYSEIQSLTTDQYGWFNATVGNGIATFGLMSNVNWATAKSW